MFVRVNRQCLLGGYSERDQLLSGSVGAIQIPAGVDQLSELRLPDGEARGDGTDTPRLFLEIPNELAAGAFFREAAAVFREHRNARAEQGAPYRRDQGYAMHQIEHRRRVGLAGTGLPATQQRIAALRRSPGCEILGAADLRRALDATTREGRARILGLEPVDHRFDAFDVRGGYVVLLA